MPMHNTVFVLSTTFLCFTSTSSHAIAVFALSWNIRWLALLPARALHMFAHIYSHMLKSNTQTNQCVDNHNNHMMLVHISLIFA